MDIIKDSFFTDIYEITFDSDNNGYNKFVEILDYLKHEKNVSYNIVPSGVCNEKLCDLVKRSNEFFGIKFEKRDLLIPTVNNQNQIYKQFFYYFDQISKNSNNIVIIDNYIFPHTYNHDYESLLISVFDRCTKLTILTKKGYNKNLLLNIKNKLKNSTKIKIIIDDSIHDRFYLSNHNGGFVLGTSLNGLMKKTSLINYLAPSDYAEINKLLFSKGVDINNL